MAKSYTVYYQTGGALNFKWHKVFDTYASKELAQASVSDLRKQGYAAHYEDTHLLSYVGMPETYEKVS